MPSKTFPIPVEHSMEALPVDSPIRQLYPEDVFPNGSIGQYAPLPYGRVRYWINGPEKAPKVVLIHGISTPSVTWTKIAPYLADQGFQVLVYDLYGKGYSEAPYLKCDATLFVTQLALLMQYVRWESTHIVGFSMGGGIAAAFSASLPHLVAGKIVLVSSAGLIDASHTPSKNRAPFKQYSELRGLQTNELPGYKRSLQSCYEDGPVRNLESSFDKLSKLVVGFEKINLEVLIIHGTDDDVVAYGEAVKINALIPTAELVTVDGAYHDVVLRDRHWQIVAEAITRFLK